MSARVDPKEGSPKERCKPAMYSSSIARVGIAGMPMMILGPVAALEVLISLLLPQVMQHTGRPVLCSFSQPVTCRRRCWHRGESSRCAPSCLRCSLPAAHLMAATRIKSQRCASCVRCEWQHQSRSRDPGGGAARHRQQRLLSVSRRQQQNVGRWLRDFQASPVQSSSWGDGAGLCKRMALPA